MRGRHHRDRPVARLGLSIDRAVVDEAPSMDPYGRPPAPVSARVHIVHTQAIDDHARSFNEGYAFHEAQERAEDPSDVDAVEAIASGWPEPVVYEDAQGETMVVVMNAPGVLFPTSVFRMHAIVEGSPRMLYRRRS